MTPPEVAVEMRRLFFAEHWKVGTIAAQLGVHHDVVRRAIETDLFVSRSLVRPSALDPFVDLMTETLRQHPRLPGTRLHEMLKARGYAGTAYQVRRRIVQLGLRPPRRSQAFLRLTAVPGEQAQVDWGHVARIRVGGCVRSVSMFVMVLSWSSGFHADFGYEQTAAAQARGHVSSFEHFQGVARNALYDNAKTVVVERVGDAVRFHPRLLELAAYYHFAPRVCRPGQAHEKGRVERKIRHLRTSFLAGRRFGDLDDLRRQFLRWRDEVAYQRPCPSDETLTVREALERERKVLLALPSHPIDTDDVRATVARKQPYVLYDTNRYSVPHALVGRPLTIAASQRRVRVLDSTAIVADHSRCWDRKQVIEDPAHLEGLLDERPRAAVPAGRARLLAAVPRAQALYVELAARGEPLGPQTAVLLGLLDRHGATVVAHAVDEALERGTPRAASVARLIDQAQRASSRPPSIPLLLPDRPAVRDVSTHNHNLEDYDALITQPETTDLP